MENELTVWETLAAVDCSDKHAKKGKFTYLSWPWAWERVKKIYPDATFVKHVYENGLPYLKDEQGYAYVQVSVTIKDQTYTEVFAVLSGGNQSIKNPNSFDVNKAFQRALVKTLAYHGLGHYIYAGEDLPESEKEQEEETPQQKTEAVKPEQIPEPANPVQKQLLWINEQIIGFEKHRHMGQHNAWASENKETLDVLKDEDKAMYDDLLKNWKKRKAVLENV
tara:strand:+ start:176 stop:841 length:666 start_codon:yes stop_codon:yes gene_type:complete